MDSKNYPSIISLNFCLGRSGVNPCCRLLTLFVVEAFVSAIPMDDSAAACCCCCCSYVPAFTIGIRTSVVFITSLLFLSSFSFLYLVQSRASRVASTAISAACV